MLLIGPGISRCVFGGYASIYPPQRILDFFQLGSLLPEFVKKAEDILLYSAISYTQKAIVPYIAARPPSGIMRQYALSREVELYFLPLASLSLERVRLLQRFHVLGDRRLRKIAGKFIV